MGSLLQGALSSKVIPAALHASVAGSASACSLLTQAAAGLQKTQTGAATQSASLLICHQACKYGVTAPPLALSTSCRPIFAASVDNHWLC